MLQTSFGMKPWYFERDCPFCTRSASSFCRNPLFFLAHAMWVKLWYHANFQPFRVHLKCFSISGSYSSKYSVSAWKITNEVRKGWKLIMWLWMVHFVHKKQWSSNKFKKMKSLCNRRVSVWNPNTSKEIVRFVHEVHPVFAVTLSSFLHMLCGWNYDTMPTFNLFRVHLKCFSISGSYSSK